jgi:hypothetical protein
MAWDDRDSPCSEASTQFDTGLGHIKEKPYAIDDLDEHAARIGSSACQVVFVERK